MLRSGPQQTDPESASAFSSKTLDQACGFGSEIVEFDLVVFWGEGELRPSPLCLNPSPLPNLPSIYLLKQLMHIAAPRENLLDSFP